MIAVIEAAKEGKKIQSKPKHSLVEYADTKPTWNFDTFDYRVKPEPTIRPYANAGEFFADMKEHGPYLKDKEVGNWFLPIRISDNGVWSSYDYFEYDRMLYAAVWQDGHPCGIEE